MTTLSQQLLAATVVGASVACANASYTYTLIADSTFSAPWVGDLNDHGDVAFRAFGPLGLGGYVGDGSTIPPLVAGWGDPLPYFDGRAINNRGQVGCRGFVPGGEVIFLDDGPTALAMPTWMGATFQYGDTPSVNDLGKVAYWGSVGGAVGIYWSNGAIAEPVAFTQSFSGPYITLETHPAINMRGSVAFIGTVPGGPTEIVAHDGVSGVNTLIADTAGAWGLSFSAFGHAAQINRAGKVAFFATSAASPAGIYIGDGTSAPAPYVQVGGLVTQLSPDFDINRCGTVAYQMRIAGLFDAIASGPNPLGNMVVRAGVMINGKVINSVRLGGINDAGQVSFFAGFTDGTWGVYRADPIAPACVPCPWDINGDGTVDGHDLTILLDGTNVINANDLNGMLNAFGPCP